MAKLKKGGGRKSKATKKKTKTKPEPEEITLSSDTEEEKDDEVMEVDEVEDDDVEDPADQDDVSGGDQHEPDVAVNGGVVKTIKLLSKDSNKTLSENVDEEEQLKSTSNDENKIDSENLITSPNENGGAAVKNSDEEVQTVENPQGFQVDIQPVEILPIGKDIAEPPEKLKPAHIWSKKDLKEQNLHLNPRVALVPLKRDLAYHDDLKQTKPKIIDPELESILEKMGNIDYDQFPKIQMANGDEAIIFPDGDTVVLPSDFLERVENRRKRKCKWADESDWVPPLTPYGGKLYIANVKIGKSIDKKKLCIPKLGNIDAAIRKMRSQERQKRYAAQKKAQELLVKQRMLQQQRGGAYGTTGTYGTAGPSGSNFYNPNSFSQSPIIQEIPVQRTPIIKNGKIIGYGIPITDPSQLPSQTPPPIYDPQSVPSVVYPKIDDSEFPEFEDYSILEPEVLLVERPGILLISDKKMDQNAAKKVMVNGKLLTLVPYQQMGRPGNNANATTAAPTGTIMPKKVEIMTNCDICGVKLPKSIIGSHMKMRHKDHIQHMLKNQQPVPQPPAPNSSQTATKTNEIQIDDNDNDFSKVTPIPPAPSVKKLIQNVEKAVTVTADGTVKTSRVTEVGPLKCQFCDYGAEKLSNLKNHTLNHFKDVLFPLLPKSIPFLCPQCNAPHRDKITLLRHFSWSHNMFFKYGSKEDLVPRPEGTPIRDPKSAKPSDNADDLVPKKISFHAPPDKTASLQERLARVSEQFKTKSPKKDPLETTNNDSKKDPLEISNSDLKKDPLEIPNNNDSNKDPLETNSMKKDPTLLPKSDSIKVVFTPPASAANPPNIQQPIQRPNILVSNPIQKKPVVVQMVGNPIQNGPIVVPKPSFHLPLPKGFEHLGLAKPPENNTSGQKNGIGIQEKVKMLEDRMTKKESPEVDNNKNS